MAKSKILVDKTEIVLNVIGISTQKNVTTINLIFNEIQSITFEPFQERKLFKSVPSERIIIKTSKNPEPLVYTKLKNKEHFETYKTDLEKFAIKNKVSFVDETK